MLAIVREWSSNDGSKHISDRSLRDRLKKIKTILKTCLPSEQHTELM